MNKDNNWPLNPDFLQFNLWRCDCSDKREHIDKSYHQHKCLYAEWLEKIEQSKQDSEEE